MAWKFFNNQGAVKRQDGVSTLVPMDPVHVVGAGGEPAFQNSWVAYGSGFTAPRFRKFPDGRVRLSGLIKSGASGNTAFTLPVGYRPLATVLFSVGASTADALMQVNTDGTVVPSNNAASNVNANVSLDGIEFDTESVLSFPGSSIGSNQAKLDAMLAIPPAHTNYGSGGLTGVVPANWDVTDTGGSLVTHVITPTIDCWWPVHAQVLARTTDAAWLRLELQLILSPADVDGETLATGDIMHHSGASDFNGGYVRRQWKLAANTTYTVKLRALRNGAVNWNLYRSPDHLWLAHEGIRPR